MNQPSSSESSASNGEDLQTHRKKPLRPEWFFDAKFSPEKNIKINLLNSRPSTENCSNEQPIWFKELINGRRHSEIIVNSVSNSINCKKERVYETPKFSPNEQFNLEPDIFTLLEEEGPEKTAQILEAECKIGESNEQFLRTPREKKNRSLSFAEDISDDFDLLFTKNKQSRSPLRILPKNSSLDLRKRDSFTAEDIHVIEVADETSNDTLPAFTEDFIIPTLPKGKEISIEIHSNWGDLNRVGMNGIEIFEARSKRKPNVQQIFCETDPKSPVERLVDGYFKTQDDSRIWTTSCRSLPVRIRLLFDQEISLVLIRIWNYNKSKILSHRGVRFIVIEMDGSTIFRGEIAKASGFLERFPETYGDTILFTTDETILEEVASNDIMFQDDPR